MRTLTVSEHRALAIQTFNDCWQVLESSNLEARHQELVTLAFTSRYHWRIAGTSKEHSISDWMISRVFCVLDQGDLALEYALSALNLLNAESPFWQIASAHEGIARAFRTLGKSEHMLEHVTIALDLLAKELSEEDAHHIRAQLADLI